MWRDRLTDATPLPHLPAGEIDAERRDRLAGPATGKQPLPGMGALPIVPEHIEELWWQHDIAVFPALALFNPNDHAFAVDRGGFETNGFRNSQAGCVTDRQNRTLLEVIHGTQEARYFVLAQHDRKLLGLPAGRNVVLDNPGPFEGDGVEEPKRGDRDNDRTGRETSFPRQVMKICPDLRWPEKIW